MHNPSSMTSFSFVSCPGSGGFAATSLDAANGKPAKKTKKAVVKTLTTADGSVLEKPKRMRTAYNIFFQHHRQVLLKTLPVRGGSKPRNSHGRCDFKKMALSVSSHWKAMSQEEKERYQELSRQDRVRYNREMKVWKELVKKHLDHQREEFRQSTVSAESSLSEVQPYYLLDDSSSSETGDSYSENDDSLEPLPLYGTAATTTHQSDFPLPSPPQTEASHGITRHSMQELADSLGPDCVEIFIRAFRNA